MLCQEPHPERHDVGSARVVRPRLDGPLPVFVLDRYEDATAQLLPELRRADRDRFVEQHAAAVRAEGPADLLLTNHVLLGGPVSAASGLPYVVRAHGSELEFSMRGDAELCAWGRATLAPARAVLAGSDHVSRVLAELVGPDPAQVHVVPPGVDVERFRPVDRAAVRAVLREECLRDAPNPPDRHDERRPDDGNAERLTAFLRGDRKTVLYVGKLSAEKGVAMLLEAVRGLDARLVVVGFGPARAELEAAAGPDVLFTGPLEHRHLQYLWPLADVSVTPSVFPEPSAWWPPSPPRAAARRWSPGTPGSRRSPPGWKPSTPSAIGTWPRSSPVTPKRWPVRCGSCWPCHTRTGWRSRARPGAPPSRCGAGSTSRSGSC